MPLVRYVGPTDAVEIVSTGDIVKRNEMVDVPDSIAKSLVMQSSWQTVTPAPPPSPSPSRARATRDNSKDKG